MKILKTPTNFLLICLVALFFLTPVSAVDGSLHWVNSSSSEVTAGSQVKSSITCGNLYMHFMDAESLQEWSKTIMIIPVSYVTVSGGDGESGWDSSVSFRYGSLSGPEVGTGIYGYQKIGTDYHITTISWLDLDITAYTGAIDLYIANSNIQVTPKTGNIRQAASLVGLGNDDVLFYYLYPTPAQNIPFSFSKSITDTDYDYYNTYSYTSHITHNYFEMNRTVYNSTRNYLDINGTWDNETTVTDTEYQKLSTDLDNMTWDFIFTNQYGENKTLSINFSTVPPTPQEEDTILWGADSYVVGDTGNYSWSMSDSVWETLLYTKVATVKLDEITKEEIELPTQTGTFYYVFEDEGNYEVKLRKRSFILPHDTVYTDTVTVLPIGESFITSTNSTIFMNTDIGMEFSYGFTPSALLQTGIEAKKLVDGEWIRAKWWTLPGSIVAGALEANTLYDETLDYALFNTDGKYVFYLHDAEKGIVATSTIYTVDWQAGIITDNVSETYLNITTGEDYVMAELLRFNFGIDNTNFTEGTNYLEFYNYDYDIITQTGIMSQQLEYKWGHLYQVGTYDSQDPLTTHIYTVLPGNNTIRIIHENASGSTTLTYDNFTVAEVNTWGYGLSLSSYEACVNEPVTITVTIPTPSNLTITAPSGGTAKTYILNSSVTLVYRFPVTGLYDLTLTKTTGTEADAVAQIYISDCVEDEEITPPSDDITDLYNNIFGFMTLPAFWGVIIWIGMVGGLAAKKAVSGNGVIFIALVLSTLLAAVGMFAPYTMYIIVSTWIFAGISFKVGQSMAKGE